MESLLITYLEDRNHFQSLEIILNVFTPADSLTNVKKKKNVSYGTFTVCIHYPYYKHVISKEKEKYH